MSFFEKGYKVALFIVIVICFSSPCVAQEQARQSMTVDAGAVYFIRNNNLWVVDLKTKQERQITRDKKISSYCVSANGRLLAYFVDAEKLYLYDLIDNKEAFLAQIKTDLTNPSFSPKAEQIVLIGYAAWVRHLWLLDIKTKKLTDLMPDSPYHHMFANWSPDGKWLSYTAFVNPWWTFFIDTDWETYLLDVLDNKRPSYKIGKGTQSQWLNKNTIIIARANSLGVYNVQSRKLVKEYKADDLSEFGDFTIENTMETLFYVPSHDGEGVKKINVYDLKSQEQRELIIDATNPTYYLKANR